MTALQHYLTIKSHNPNKSADLIKPDAVLEFQNECQIFSNNFLQSNNLPKLEVQ